LATDSSDNSSWSGVRAFNLSNPFKPTAPQRHPTVETISFYFKGICENSTDPNSPTINYEFYVDTSNPPTTLKQNSTNTTYTADFANNTYYFRCRANDNEYNSDYTEVTTYLIDNTALWNTTVETKTPVYESSLNDFYLNVTYNNRSNFITDVSGAELHYDGAVYSMTESTISNNTYRFKAGSVLAPFKNSVSFLYNITITYVNGSKGYETIGNFTQTIIDLNMYSCDGSTNATSVIAFNFTLRDEYFDSLFNISNRTSGTSEFDIKMDMNYFLDDSSNYKNLSIVANNVTNLTICMNPADASYNHTTIVDYGGEGYDRRQYHFNKDNFNNATDHINLYLLEISKASSTIITVEDESGGALENYIVNIKKYFVGTDEHKTIGMLKTNIDGQDHIYLQHNEPFYKFIITDPNNDIVYTSGDTKITRSSVTLTVGGVSWGEEVDEFEETSVNANFDNSTRTFSLTYSGKDDDVDKICMKVTQERRSGTTLVGTKCSTSTSDTLTQTVTGDGLFVMNAWGEKDTVKYPLISKTHDDRKTYSTIIGTEGLFLALLVILIISFAMIWSPTAAIFGSIVGIIIAFLFGFINLGVGSIIGLIIVGIILMIKSKV
jgi:hypothetical protein